MDRKREKSLDYVSAAQRRKSSPTPISRIAREPNIMRWVRGSLHERVKSYRVALERMVIAAPSPMAVEAERQLTLLQQRAGAYGV